jgi:hypothetical protein
MAFSCSGDGSLSSAQRHARNESGIDPYLIEEPGSSTDDCCESDEAHVGPAHADLEI